MRQLLMIAVCLWVLLTCASCIFDNEDNNSDEQDNYLYGTIKDADGNDITDASVFIMFNDMWEDAPNKNSSHNEISPTPIPFNSNNDPGSTSALRNTTKLCISSAYLGDVRTIISSHQTLSWDGKDNDGNRVCNGVYSYLLTTTNATDSVLSSISGDLLLNDGSFNNSPAVVSSAKGYRIPLMKYFQFGKQIPITDESGFETGYFTINGNFEICIRKAGFQPISRHISLSSYEQNHKEDFVLQQTKK